MTEDSAPMSSHRPYLLRALYQWIADNGMTPHLLVDAGRPAVQVPMHAVKDGRIVLNVAERAVVGLDMGNDAITFSARFGGVSHAIRVPIAAVLAIYARETGQGMALPEDLAGADGDEGVEGAAGIPGPAVLSAVPNVPNDGDQGDDGDDPGHPTPRRGGHLRIVK